MTIAELLLGALALFVVYRLLGPLQKRIERTLLRSFGARGQKDRFGRGADVIDITPRTSQPKNEEQEP